MAESLDILIERKDKNQQEDEDFINQQTREIKELHDKLLQLKDENQKQLDKITEGLNELLITKTIIDQSFNLPENQKDLQSVEKKYSHLKIADLLEKLVDEETKDLIDHSDENSLKDEKIKESPDLEKDSTKCDQSENTILEKMENKPKEQHEIMETEINEKKDGNIQVDSPKVKKEPDE